MDSITPSLLLRSQHLSIKTKTSLCSHLRLNGISDPQFQLAVFSSVIKALSSNVNFLIFHKPGISGPLLPCGRSNEWLFGTSIMLITIFHPMPVSRLQSDVTSIIQLILLLQNPIAIVLARSLSMTACLYPRP